MRRTSTPLATAILCLGLLGWLLLPRGAFAEEAPRKPTASEIAELKREIEALRAENQRLRRLFLEETERSAKAVASNRAKTRGPETPVVDAGPTEPAVSSRYRVSNSGKRHNARCRYFSSAGRACTKDEGVACKVCGG